MNNKDWFDFTDLNHDTFILHDAWTEADSSLIPCTTWTDESLLSVHSSIQSQHQAPPTCQYRLVYSEFMSPNTEKDVTERRALEQLAQVFAESALRHLDGSAVGLARHIHRVTHHAHLWRDITAVTIMRILLYWLDMITEWPQTNDGNGCHWAHNSGLSDLLILKYR